MSEVIQKNLKMEVYVPQLLRDQRHQKLMKKFVQKMEGISGIESQLDIHMFYNICQGLQSLPRTILMQNCAIFAKIESFITGEGRTLKGWQISSMTFEEIVELAKMYLQGRSIDEYQFKIISMILQDIYEFCSHSFQDMITSKLKSLFLACLNQIHMKKLNSVGEAIYAELLGKSEKNYREFTNFFDYYLNKDTSHQEFSVLMTLIKGFAKRLPSMMKDFANTSDQLRRGYTLLICKYCFIKNFLQGNPDQVIGFLTFKDLKKLLQLRPFYIFALKMSCMRLFLNLQIS